MSNAAKKANEPTPPAGESALAHLDIAVTGPGNIGAAIPRKPSPAELAAADMRKRFGHITQALIADRESPMRPTGACLMTAHILAELGEEKAQKLTADDVAAYGHSIRARFPEVWHAAARNSPAHLALHAQTRGIRDPKADRIDMVKEYQRVSSQLFGA